jgi:hypothetical protein
LERVLRMAITIRVEASMKGRYKSQLESFELPILVKKIIVTIV